MYHLHPAIKHAQAMAQNLAADTGRELDDWRALVEAEDPKDPKAWLKAEYGLGAATAGLILDPYSTDEDHYLAQAPAMVDAQYSGKKAALRPLYDAIEDLLLSLSDEVKLCPAKTQVAAYHNKVFATVKAASMQAIELGLALGPERPFEGRYQSTGGLEKKDRITHRVRLTSVSELDQELQETLAQAFELGR
ncbi:DUF5655 domain-containing protein [Gallaecimonas xiamenensis]|uniref:DUF5655 domain-containing protein n=1 Tax=Gallaecimonas xiamenensis 3-C-1 TaxID=745411 RepID=K2KHG8_9GAMM|nr:DUF5655 domain-containing protein [Gallaecimonas xiamenensis]EKE76695.1 hypothetical protein B3C1_03840 [Gallaecimonas xiamenensis 3-C-1]